MTRIIILLILCCIFIGCDKIVTDSNESSQFIVIYLDNHDEYYDSDSQSVIDSVYTNVYGWIDCNPYCEFQHLKLDTLIFSGKDYTYTLLGYQAFPPDDNLIRLFSDFYQLDVELQTSLGKVNGNISLPDTIMKIELSETNNLPLSTLFTISWAGSNADFYYVACDYKYNDNGMEYKYLADYTSDMHYTFEDSIFSFNGTISNIIVQSINGPIPKVGAEGNMSGNGFLYYSSKFVSYNGDQINVGSGINRQFSSQPTNTLSEEELNAHIKIDINNRLLGHPH